MVCEFFRNLLSVMIDVVLAVNSETKMAPTKIHKTHATRPTKDFGALSPYLEHIGRQSTLSLTEPRVKARDSSQLLI